ncbi:putative ficolin-1-like [Apostichopus japonicus]|uniref:Putative ficolin-1-like n=1 Tax=Stichopus japonicus TaxID=307972 RepID=A0A2G8LPU4_STIJA|nr:putative ficolin-1-like [Apostichopus japonicus]
MANCLVTWTYIFLAGLLIRQNIDFVIAMGLCEFEDLMMKNAGGEQDQRDTISTLGTDMSDQSATTVYSTDGMRISPSTDEMTTGMPKTDTISTLGTDMSDQSATTVYSTDGMRISPSTDELITPFENLVSTTVMPTADETMLLQSTDKMTTIDKEEFSTTSMSSTGHLLPERISHETTRSMNKKQLFMSTVDPSSTTATTRRNELSTTRTPTAESCPNNMIWMNCSCQTTCDDPEGLHGCFKSCNDEPGYTCVCPDGFQIRDGACIPLEECGCYHSPTGVISLFQRRVDASVSFINTWITYRDGFGDLNSSFWLGNEKLHVISAERDHQLRIEIWFNTANDASEYLHYNLFRISSEATKYEITLGSYTGSFEYDYMDYHRDMKFTTYDQDNDVLTKIVL